MAIFPDGRSAPELDCEVVEVNLREHKEEVYVLARSQGRRNKERAIRRRRLKKLWGSLHELHNSVRRDLLA
ncbi:MAG: hypothetical protein GY792_20200 [Gammaproteobacteria bacterium]|nr:hypothetical protein [Gammaproteobacteria bacterium]